MNYILGLLNFKSTKERDDFIIAVLVLLFFAWLMWWLFPRFSGDSTPPQLPETANIPVIADVAEGTDITHLELDSDGDGVNDEDDKCPTLAGNDGYGCPSDTDGDGVIDSEDKCPKIAGIASLNGCPMDSDNDGVFDKDDKCPNRAGIASLGGCPEAEVEAEEKRILEEAVQGVEFKTGSAELMRTSRSIMYRIVKIMNKYPEYKLEIIGHTDNTGEKKTNQQLSLDRAKTCHDYFVENGISADRMSYKGYGQRKPIESNETEEGRSKNRRVEFNLSY